MVGFKRRVNVIMSLLLSIVFLFMFAAGGIFVKAEEIDEITEEEAELISEFIADVQLELSEDNTAVEYILYEYIDHMNFSTSEQLNEIGEATEQILQDYNEVFNPGAVQPQWLIIGNKFRGNYLLRASVAAAVAYFLHNGYRLSAELLIKARTNNFTEAIYVPFYSGVVTNTPLFKEIGADDSWDRETSAQFQLGATVAENDAHYAINWFDFTTERCGDDTLIHISDVYDFDFDDTYSGIVGYATCVMAIAQRVGVLTQYNVRINKWYYGEASV